MAMQVLQAIQLLPTRSDGKAVTITKSGVKEANAPLPEELIPTVDRNGTKSYYHKLAHDNPKAIDWRKKIAGMIMQRSQGNDFKSNDVYILECLPENYQIYEHIKESAPGAKGSHDRQDAYCYGHPDGKKKRYRSPADFFLHVWWLIQDGVDRDDCECKMCSPDDKRSKRLTAREEPSKQIGPAENSALQSAKLPSLAPQSSSAETAPAAPNPQSAPQYVPQQVPQQVPRQVPQQVPKHAIQQVPQQVPEQAPQHFPQPTPQPAPLPAQYASQALNTSQPILGSGYDAFFGYSRRLEQPGQQGVGNMAQYVDLEMMDVDQEHIDPQTPGTRP